MERGDGMNNPAAETHGEDDCPKISADVKESFRHILKSGIYKELHRRELLSDAQLNLLLRNK